MKRRKRRIKKKKKKKEESRTYCNNHYISSMVHVCECCKTESGKVHRRKASRYFQLYLKDCYGRGRGWGVKASTDLKRYNETRK